MKTLIELYDERPIENVLATEVFRPERTVFLCPPEIAADRELQGKLKEYFKRFGLSPDLIFRAADRFSTAKILEELKEIVATYEDCAVDISGGTDAALFACGMLCKETKIPAFTYSRRKNRFFEIHDAEYAEKLECNVKHKVEDCFLMAGGAIRQGRVDNAVLSRYLDQAEPFFQLYLKYKRQWTQAVRYMQKVSQGEKGTDPKSIPLFVEAGYSVKGDNGGRVTVPSGYLKDLQKIGFIGDLQEKERTVSFRFTDHQTRTWLRDIGSVLEIYVYKKCLDTGLFDDVKTSVIVDWNGDHTRDNVTNEIDVMATFGITPLFISCKTSELSTVALNELAILRDRFGGKGAKAAAVTSRNCLDVTRHRASELEIEVIDINDLKSGRIEEHLRNLFQAERFPEAPV